MRVVGKRYAVLKRLLDFFIASAGLIVLAPVIACTAVIILIASGRPVFFVHKRVGQHGKPFNMYKFRTMVTDAEQLIASFTESQRKEFFENFKLKCDPRITCIGRILRKTNLDELPQILNILKGEMSLVGPRPIVKEELLKYEGYMDKLLAVKPGLTGLWQVQGRGRVTYDERVRMDMTYVDNMSFAMDLTILYKTFVIVLRHKDYY